MSTKNFSEWRKRESFAANLQNGAPSYADVLAGNGVALADRVAVEADAVNQTEGLKGIDGVVGLLRAIALHHPVELAAFIQNRDTTGDTAPTPIVGMFLTGGEYFWVDAEGVNSLDDLCFQGRLHSIDKAEFSWVMEYFHKYVFKRGA